MFQVTEKYSIVNRQFKEVLKGDSLRLELSLEFINKTEVKLQFLQPVNEIVLEIKRLLLICSDEERLKPNNFLETNQEQHCASIFNSNSCNNLEKNKNQIGQFSVISLEKEKNRNENINQDNVISIDSQKEQTNHNKRKQSSKFT